MKKKFLALAVALCMLCLTACSSAGAISTYTIALEQMPKNFDPQVASGANEVMVLTNIYDGLFELRGGKVVPNVCESWSVSQDGLTYTFNLRNDSTFFLSKSEQLPVTSRDFAFALQRVLDPSTHSPYYNDFAHIESISSLQDYVLEIKLKHKDNDFLSKLCSPGAYPCNYEFFMATNGAYGLRVKDILSNGPYTINYLADDGSYATIIRIDGNDSVISRIRVSLADKETTIADQYKNDKISGFFADNNDISALDGTVFEYENQNFNMVFNPNRLSLGNSFTRGALAHYCFAMEKSGANLAAVNQSYSIFNGSVMFNGTAVTDQLSPYTPDYMTATPKELLYQGLEIAQLAKMENLTVLIPSDVSYKVIAENINQLWQRELGLFFTLEFIPNSEIAKRVESGSFDIAFLSSTPASSNAANVLKEYKGLDGDLSTWVQQLESGTLSEDDAIKIIGYAHNHIISQAYIVPMCTDTSKYIHKSYFKDIDVNPFGNVVNLKYATVK